MGVKWLVFLITTWFILAIMGLVIENASVGGNETSVLNTLMATKAFIEVNSVPLPVPNPSFWNAVYNVATFKLAMFTGFWAIFRWLFLAIGIAIIINVAFSLASLVRGGGSAST